MVETRPISPDLLVGDPMMGVPVGPYGRRYGHLLIGLSHPKKMFEWADIAPKNGIVTPSEHRAALQKNIPKTCAERPFLPPPTVLATAATASATPQAHGVGWVLVTVPRQ